VVNTAQRKRRGSLHRFYLVEPKPNADAGRIAEKLIALKQVEEVFLSDGDYGFIVKVRFIDGKEPPNVADYLKQNVATRFGTADSYYKYRK
jgi:DNA-binding Lrp family transcriptional regulator